MATPSSQDVIEVSEKFEAGDSKSNVSHHDVGEIAVAEGVSPRGGLQRKLGARHIQMIAIGSNVGTGLFIGSGSALHKGGPLALVLGFLIIGIVLFIMMECLGEMTVILPVPGSFTRYATRFIDPALGFAMGWQYWLCWVAVFATEATAANILIQYWTTEVHTGVWITLFILINVVIHIFPVRIFGEVEFVVSTIKVFAVLGFILVTWVIIAGGAPDGRTRGGEYWIDPGPLANGFQGIAAVFVIAAFACGGTEMVGIVSGESEHPRRNIPRAINTLMARIFVFYVVSMIFITLVVPSNSPNLLGGENAGSSPFVIAIKDAGISVLPDILNAIVLMCVCSVGSVSIYIGSRVLVSMAQDGFAFKWFERTDLQGRPVNALIFTTVVGSGLSYLNLSDTGSQVFSWFTSISGMAFFLAWLTIIACNWRFHAALKFHGDTTMEQRFSYRATLWPWLSIFGFFAVVFMIFCQFYVSLYPIGGAKPSADVFFGGFLGVPIFLVMGIGYKIFYNTKIIKLQDIDLYTGRREFDPAEEQILEEEAAMSKWKKVLSYAHP